MIIKLKTLGQFLLEIIVHKYCRFEYSFIIHTVRRMEIPRNFRSEDFAKMANCAHARKTKYDHYNI